MLDYEDTAFTDTDDDSVDTRISSSYGSSSTSRSKSGSGRNANNRLPSRRHSRSNPASHAQSSVPSSYSERRRTGGSVAFGTNPIRSFTDDKNRSYMSPSSSLTSSQASMVMDSGETAADLLMFFEKARKAYAVLRNTPMFSFLSTVASRSDAPMNKLIVDYDLISTHPPPSKLMTKELAQLMLASDQSDGSDRSTDLLNAMQQQQQNGSTGGSSGSNGGSSSSNTGTGGSTPPKIPPRTGKSPPNPPTSSSKGSTSSQTSQTMDLLSGLTFVGSQITNGLVDAFGGTQSITLKELRQRGLFSYAILEYEKRKDLESFERLLRTNAAREQIIMTEKLTGVIDECLIELKTINPSLSPRYGELELDHFLPDKDARVRFAQYVGASLQERVISGLPFRTYQVNYPRAVNRVASIVKNFRTARFQNGMVVMDTSSSFFGQSMSGQRNITTNDESKYFAALSPFSPPSMPSRYGGTNVQPLPMYDGSSVRRSVLPASFTIPPLI